MADKDNREELKPCPFKQLSETEEKLKRAYEFILKNCPEMEIVSDGFTDCVPAIEANIIRDEAQNWLEDKE